MIKMLVSVIILLSTLICNVLAQSDCQNGGSPGKCTLIDDCNAALEQINKSSTHDFFRCGFEGQSEIVCCPSLTSQPAGGAKSRQACQRWKADISFPVPPQIGGKNALEGEFPHMVALGLYREVDKMYHFYCSGSIISENYILSAAHCIANIERDKVKIVRIGTVAVPESVSQPDPAIDYNVAEVKIHERYNRRSKLHDIALIKLEKTLRWTNYIKPACLYLKNNAPNRLYIAGWGHIGLVFNSPRQTTLQKEVVKLETLSECNAIYMARANKSIAETLICATEPNTNSCVGDSGGPLQISEPNSDLYAIIGVASYGIGCGGRYPGVYTRVYSYLDWIEKIVWP